MNELYLICKSLNELERKNRHIELWCIAGTFFAIYTEMRLLKMKTKVRILNEEIKELKMHKKEDQRLND